MPDDASPIGEAHIYTHTYISIYINIYVPVCLSYQHPPNYPMIRGLFFVGLQNAFLWDFPGGSDGKASVYHAGDPGLSPGLGRSPGEGNGNPLQYYCLENPMDRGAW